MKEMMNDECGMMNEREKFLHSSFRTLTSALLFILSILFDSAVSAGRNLEGGRGIKIIRP
jgi:hypothetical protein